MEFMALSLNSGWRMSEALVHLYLRLNKSAWKCLPSAVRNSAPVLWYGTILHGLVCRYAERRQFCGTFFLRNRPELELIRRLVSAKPEGSVLRIAVLGCSVGAEVYSILWTIRSARPDMKVYMCAVDNAAEVLNLAAMAIYTSQTCGLVGA